MRSLLTLLLLLLVPLSFTSCRHGRTGPQGEPGMNGADGQDGQNGKDGADGINGKDGLNGIGFDYVRGITGAELCESFLVIPANLVIPSSILNLAPPTNWDNIYGSTLTFGDVELSFRYYLAPMRAGEYCVIERDEGWNSLGSVTMQEKGLLAVVPLGTIQTLALDPGVLSQGVLVNLEPTDCDPDGCVTLKFDGRRLYFGRNIRINFCCRD